MTNGSVFAIGFSIVSLAFSTFVALDVQSCKNKEVVVTQSLGEKDVEAIRMFLSNGYPELLSLDKYIDATIACSDRGEKASVLTRAGKVGDGLYAVCLDGSVIYAGEW